MAQIELFRDREFLGGSITRTDDDANLSDAGFNDALSSVIVTSGTFTLFQNGNFEGFSVTVCRTGGPDSDGRYPGPESFGGRNDFASSLRRNSDQPV